MKPEQLGVPEDKFLAQFGGSLKDALASGKVLKAMEGYAKLGLDVAQMDAGLGTVPGECAGSAYMDRLEKEVYDYMEAC